jgi:uncharacterized membrane protein YbhN (UPF0104 family)
VLVILLVGAAVALWTKRRQFLSGIGLLGHLSYPLLVMAVAAQVISFLALARLQWIFLQPGSVEITTTEMAELTAAHNAITMSVPGGVAWSTAFLFEQLRRRGATPTLAGWAILVSGAVSSFSLFVLLAVGVEWAHRGPVVVAKAPIAFLAAIPPALAVAGIVGHLRGHSLSEAVAWTSARMSRWPKVQDRIDHTAARLGQYQPSVWQWARAFGLSAGNWLLDLGCLVGCIRALGVSVPWPGVVIAYALAKVAGTFPITPGGLGVVEAGVAGLLVVYGMSAPRALAVTLLYRLISFWALLPIGWSYWAWLKLGPGTHKAVPGPETGAPSFGAVD